MLYQEWWMRRYQAFFRMPPVDCSTSKTTTLRGTYFNRWRHQRMEKNPPAMESNPARTWARWRSMHQRRSNLLDGVFVGFFHFSQLTPLEFLAFTSDTRLLNARSCFMKPRPEVLQREERGRFRVVCVKLPMAFWRHSWLWQWMYGSCWGPMLKMISWNGNAENMDHPVTS